MGISQAKKLGEKKNLEQILIEWGELTPESLAAAYQKAMAAQIPIHHILVREKYISDVTLARAFSEQSGLEYIDLSNFILQENVFNLIPERILHKHSFLPLEVINDQIIVAVKDPDAVFTINNVGRVLQKKLGFKIAPESHLAAALKKALSAKTQPVAVGARSEKLEPISVTPSVTPMPPTAEGAKPGFIEELIQKITEAAIAARASDIHVEPEEKIVRIRVRTDGVLRELQTVPIESHAPIISRLKVVAGLDIAEKRNAQDGSFQLQIENRTIDFRLSTLPTIRGEKAVLRILDKSALKVSLDELGLSPHLLQTLAQILEIPHGLILVTGPTGSGKTTTVYSMLNHINSLDKNIITVEDPVELQFSIINQVQVNSKAGLTFASVLRNILRQDPDVIMIGEVRDKETADLAIRAALTGHMVISTIHTNDSISTVTRLIDMGVEPFLVSSSLMGIISQRLVRVLCPDCKQQRPITPDDMLIFKSVHLDPKIQFIYEPQGCPKCHRSGFLGRMPIFELLVPNTALKKGISGEKTAEELLPVLQAAGFQPMRVDGLMRVIQGITSLDEILKVTI